MTTARDIYPTDDTGDGLYDMWGVEPPATHFQDNGKGFCVHCQRNPAGHEMGSAECFYGYVEDPDDYREPEEYDICPEHGEQLIEGYGSTGGPDPYTTNLMACGHKLTSFGPGDDSVIVGKTTSGDFVPARYR